MHFLRARLFGAFQLSCDCGAADLPLRPAARLLLAYLLLHGGRGYRRDQLASIFWGDLSEEEARRHLSQTLWRLRAALLANGGPHADELLLATSEEVGLSLTGNCWLDVTAFEEAATTSLAKSPAAYASADVAVLKEALALYTGDLLEGYYQDWIIRERERLMTLFLSSLAHLMRHYRRNADYERAISCGHRILTADPLREDIHRELMRLYTLNHQRALAVQQYQNCRAILAQELGIAPMPETKALYARIVGPRTQHRPERPTEPKTFRQVLRQLDLSISGLDDARDQLRQVLQSLVRLNRRANPGHGQFSDTNSESPED